MEVNLIPWNIITCSKNSRLSKGEEILGPCPGFTTEARGNEIFQRSHSCPVAEWERVQLASSMPFPMLSL